MANVPRVLDRLSEFLAIQLAEERERRLRLQDERDDLLRRTVYMTTTIERLNRVAQKYFSLSAAVHDYLRDSDDATIDVMTGYMLDADLVNHTNVLEDFRFFMPPEDEDSGSDSDYVPPAPYGVPVIDLTASDSDTETIWDE